MKVVKNCAYVSDEFHSRHDGLNGEIQGAHRNLAINRWVIDAPIRHEINCWVMNQVEQIMPKRILEIGGGVSYFNYFLNKRYEYVNVDFLAHRSEEEVRFSSNHEISIVESDWRDFDFSGFDLCIALDIFPNVDQGISAFLRKSADIQTLLMSFTVFEIDRFYRAKRLDGDEILTMVPWNLQQLQREVSSEISNLDILTDIGHVDSAFSNNRNVFLVSLHNE